MSLRDRAKLLALRIVFVATALPGTVLGVTGLVLWAIADGAESAAQPLLRDEDVDDEAEDLPS